MRLGDGWRNDRCRASAYRGHRSISRNICRGSVASKVGRMRSSIAVSLRGKMTFDCALLQRRRDSLRRVLCLNQVRLPPCSRAIITLHSDRSRLLTCRECDRELMWDLPALTILTLATLCIPLVRHPSADERNHRCGGWSYVCKVGWGARSKSVSERFLVRSILQIPFVGFEGLSKSLEGTPGSRWGALPVKSAPPFPLFFHTAR